MIQLLIALFVGFILWRTSLRYKASDITGREFSMWVIFWLVIVSASFLPTQADKFAQLVGVERGADLFVYISIIFLFFALFKILVQLQSIKRDITRIVRKNAIAQVLEDKDNQPKD
jgi:hypothetical protein